MKDAKETLFEQMQPNEKGGVEITTEGILIAMENHAKDRAVAFLMSRIPNLSKFEVERLYDLFTELEKF